MVNIYIKTTITKLSHHFHLCVPIMRWSRGLGSVTMDTCVLDCFSGGDVITRLCDVDLLVLNVYSFGTNVKYSAKNSLFDNKFLF